MGIKSAPVFVAGALRTTVEALLLNPRPQERVNIAKTHVNALLTMICLDCFHNGSCPLALPATHRTLLYGWPGGREG